MLVMSKKEEKHFLLGLYKWDVWENKVLYIHSLIPNIDKVTKKDTQHAQTLD